MEPASKYPPQQKKMKRYIYIFAVDKPMANHSRMWILQV